MSSTATGYSTTLLHPDTSRVNVVVEETVFSTLHSMRKAHSLNIDRIFAKSEWKLLPSQLGPVL